MPTIHDFIQYIEKHAYLGKNWLDDFIHSERSIFESQEMIKKNFF